MRELSPALTAEYVSTTIYRYCDQGFAVRSSRLRDNLVYEAESCRVLKQCSDLCSSEARRDLRVDFKLQRDIRPRQCSELFDDGFHDLMNLTSRPLRGNHNRSNKARRKLHSSGRFALALTGTACRLTCRFFSIVASGKRVAHRRHRRLGRDISQSDVRHDDDALAINDDRDVEGFLDHDAAIRLRCIVPSLRIGKRSRQHPGNRSLNRLD